MHLQVVALNLRSRRHWVIGDVHGCHQPLCHLLATLPPSDHLVFCGDVINRGEAIPATMDLVWDLVQAGSATWLRGNHEQDLIDALESQDGLSQHATYAQLGDSSARQWLPRLQQLPLIYRGDGWCATHAGFNAAGHRISPFVIPSGRPMTVVLARLLWATRPVPRWNASARSF